VSLAVVGLGGNALAPRGLDATVAVERANVRTAAVALAPVARAGGLVVTHGNGPQVGLLALEQARARRGLPDPLDVLDACTEGALGYLVELALANAVPERRVATVLTQVVLRADDPAFGRPTKPVGPTYRTDEPHPGWTLAPVEGGWRRVVPSPDPQRVVELGAVAALVAAGFVVVCAGGGGIPVVETVDGLVGTEAVIDKDLTTALVAEGLRADALALLTDVEGVMDGFGSPAARLMLRLTVAQARAMMADLPAGSMGPKLGAAARFVAATGRRAGIGTLAAAAGVLAGDAGTQIVP
jgi:carbamate kinase